MRQLLQSLCQHNPCTGYRVIGNNHFTHGNPDPQQRANIVSEPLVEISLVRLKRQGRGNGIRGALELGQQRITAQFAYLAVIAGNRFIETLKGILNPLVSFLLILLNQASRADDIRMQNYSKFAG
jgi:hypothetical protein